MKLCELLVYYHDSMSEIARAAGLTRGAITQWKRRKAVPYARQCQIQVLTRGKLKARKEDDPNYRDKSS